MMLQLKSAARQVCTQKRCRKALKCAITRGDVAANFNTAVNLAAEQTVSAAKWLLMTLQTYLPLRIHALRTCHT